MNISALKHDQLVGLVALLEAVVMADKTVSPAEQDVLGTVVDAVGKDMYRAALEDADDRFEGLASLKSYLGSIEEQDVRHVIYGTAWQEAVASPSVNHQECALLTWLADTWQIKTDSAEAE